MNKYNFFHIENGSCSVTESSLNDLSFENVSVDIKKEEKKCIDHNEFSNDPKDTFDDGNKRNALDFLGLYKKNEKPKIQNASNKKSTEEKNCISNFQYENRTLNYNNNDTNNNGNNNIDNSECKALNNTIIRTPNDTYSKGIVGVNGETIDNRETLSNSFKNVHNKEFINNSCVNNKKEDPNDIRNVTKNEFYCLKKIIDNNLNNNYDKNEVRIFHIYHDNRAECLFNDISIIKFYAHNNICIYENKYYIYNEINSNLFQKKNEIEKGIEKEISFDIGKEDIYEYIYKEKIKLKNNNSNINNNEIKNKDDNCCQKQMQRIQFYMHKLPFFLKEKIKIFIHIYNMFSIHPYINHKFIEDGMYSKNLKIYFTFEKFIYIKWRFYSSGALQDMLKDIVLKKKNNKFMYNCQNNFVKINDFIYINFLTQEIKIYDIHNDKFDENNYIILNGNGLCFSVHYYIMVPYHRHVSENMVTPNECTNENVKNNINCNYNKDYNLNYEYVYISQLFNIYDDFDITFLYPLYISYVFYYHLFVEDKIKDNAKIVDNVTLEQNKIKNVKYELNEKNRNYDNTLESSYLNHLNDIYIKLSNCFERKILDSKNSNIKIENDTITFLIPKSCYINSENGELMNKKTHHLSLLYAVCISKYNINEKNNILNNEKNNYTNEIYQHEKNYIFPINGIPNKTKLEQYSYYCDKNYGNIEYSENRLNEEKIDWKILCMNEIKEVNNIRSIFPNHMKEYFNTCNKIDNIIKISIRNDGICFFYVKNIIYEYIFFSYFIIFNSMKNLFDLIYKQKGQRNNINSEYAKNNESEKYNNNSNANNYKCDNFYTKSEVFTYNGKENEIISTLRNYDNVLNICNNKLNENDINYYNVMHIKNETLSTFENITKVFDINNINSIYNDLYICENKKITTFKLVNVMNKEKKNILTPYYFNHNILTEIFFIKLSNIHIFDINRQLNTVFEYIDYNNKTFTPFLEEYKKYEMNIQLDLLENMYNINNELYLLYVKKINFSHDIYKYNYLFVLDHLLKNYILYYNIYFIIHDKLKKSNYYKLKYTNKNKETISVHFTVSFNYLYDKTIARFKLKPKYYITHIEQDSNQIFDEKNYISFIRNYVNTKCIM
ncbi:conserved Plasmodium protein, unknown function [Plasmodium yoelii]|uniref:Uncharacterized protein n=2 Tax=Plasmodium yoelii TaxID=5861 RepID=A0AAE9WVC0_PLAYO|nr:conserved Plasmodium protein, unknown function [Plasmodium yoelii]WBY60862.1 hypothetical protein Py17XNL_001401122 [Plasmodium yoelii yoelii]CDU20628.1 conserved Plasmodium protein, unknown function [Plasmodium yoelii]VTZ81590.1 conserved Plasmodium protein, unknown function [Plasmodium yoelii]|eukprot:XP_725012.2 conserved Plasmodium protein, unknown function [Plasmodium yoelii]